MVQSDGVICRIRFTSRASLTITSWQLHYQIPKHFITFFINGVLKVNTRGPDATDDHLCHTCHDKSMECNYFKNYKVILYILKQRVIQV